MEDKRINFDAIGIDEQIEVNGGNSVFGIERLIELARTVFNALSGHKER